MKRQIVKVKQPKPNKETPEERLARIQQWQTTRTRVVPDKKKTYNRQKYKEAIYG